MAVLTLPNHAVCNDLAKKAESYSNQNCAREIHTDITSEAMQEKKKRKKRRNISDALRVQEFAHFWAIDIEIIGHRLMGPE